VQECYLFEGCDPVWVRALVQHIVPTVWLAGDHVIREGEASEGLYVVATGRLDLHSEQSGHVYARVTAPDLLGDWAMLSKQPHAFSAQVRSVCDRTASVDTPRALADMRLSDSQAAVTCEIQFIRRATFMDLLALFSHLGPTLASRAQRRHDFIMRKPGSTAGGELECAPTQGSGGLKERLRQLRHMPSDAAPVAITAAGQSDAVPAAAAAERESVALPDDVQRVTGSLSAGAGSFASVAWNVHRALLQSKGRHVWGHGSRDVHVATLD